MNWNRKEIYDTLAELIDETSMELDASMKERTSFRAGGSAALLVEPKTLADLFSVMELLNNRKIPHLVMGNGSNLLFRDGGYGGVVVGLKQINRVRIEGNVLFAEPGILLSQLAKEAMEQSLTGMEFASGIPGSLGGAVFMNAGAYGGEMKDIVISTASLMGNGMMKDRNREALEFGYRHSVFQNSNEVIIGVKIALKPGDRDEIRDRMKELTAKRNEKQPVHLPSAGSFFKRPEGHFAGQLIEAAGLKGLSVGGASVSKQHAGFIVNDGEATAKDILDLMAVVQQTVKDQSGVELQPEVQIK